MMISIDSEVIKQAIKKGTLTELIEYNLDMASEASEVYDKLTHEQQIELEESARRTSYIPAGDILFYYDTVINQPPPVSETYEIDCIPYIAKVGQDGEYTFENFLGYTRPDVMAWNKRTKYGDYTGVVKDMKSEVSIDPDTLEITIYPNQNDMDKLLDYIHTVYQSIGMEVFV